LGHKTSHCVLFRDLVQEGKLKFGDKSKPQMQVDVDPLKSVDAMYTEVADCNVTPALIVSRIIKSALKLILDTLIFTIPHCHQDNSSTTTTTEVL
jgi:hypothetical protein